MEFERTSVAQFNEIVRLIEAGHKDRQIARTLRCRRTLVAGIRKGTVTQSIIERPRKEERALQPAWALRVDWALVEKDIRDGYQIKRIWEEIAANLTSHSNFFKYVKIRYANLLSASVTLREFKPGEYCEVDYAGDKVEWLNIRTGEINKAHIFVGILCYSQKIFAWAAEDEKKSNWIESHRRMFEFYGGVNCILVSDQLKNGVLKSHRYDPDLNPDYIELAKHYNTVVVPARARRPRDKALVENAVGILMRYFKFIYRRRTFTSIVEINKALRVAVDKINNKIHSRFKTSRQERFENLEKAYLQALPLEPYELSEWKRATIHPDCTISAELNFYSVPHIYRGKEVRVKISTTYVEVFLNFERIAIHSRLRSKVGERVIDPMHLPENARAYREATPQTILAQARFSHIELYKLIDELFQENTLGHLRRAQGLVRKTYSIIQTYGRETSTPWLLSAIAQMRRFNKIRVRYFDELIKTEIKNSSPHQEDRTIVRKSGNPMVRGHGTHTLLDNNQNVPQIRLI